MYIMQMFVLKPHNIPHTLALVLAVRTNVTFFIKRKVEAFIISRKEQN
jgi:hypothetical protein